MNDAQRRRAGRAVADRIVQMNTTQAGVAHAAGVSRRTLSALVAGEHWPTDAVQKRIEAVLRWRDGDLVTRAVKSDRDGTVAGLSDVELADELARRLHERDRRERRLRASD